MNDKHLKLELLNDPEFRQLSRSRNRICITLTVLTLIVYYGFIFLLAFNKPFFGKKITTNITVGMPIGIGVIVLSVVLTGTYVRWANKRYDLMVRNIKSRVENANGPGAGR